MDKLLRQEGASKLVKWNTRDIRVEHWQTATMGWYAQCAVLVPMKLFTSRESRSFRVKVMLSIDQGWESAGVRRPAVKLPGHIVQTTISHLKTEKELGKNATGEDGCSTEEEDFEF